MCRGCQVHVMSMNSTEALILSGISIAVAGLSLGWNVYRDVISKSARVKVGGMIGPIVTPGVNKIGPMHIVISAVNCGPAKTTLECFWLKKDSFFKNPESATIFPDHENPLSATFPCELEVGKRAQFIFPFNSNCFLKMDLSHIGLSDVFGKTHWMKRSKVKEMGSHWRQEFQESAGA